MGLLFFATTYLAVTLLPITVYSATSPLLNTNSFMSNITNGFLSDFRNTGNDVWSWLTRPATTTAAPLINLGAFEWPNLTQVNPFSAVSTWFTETNGNNWLTIGCRYFGSALSTYRGNGTSNEVPDDATPLQRRTWLANARSNDINQCITLMVCDCGRAPTNYGILPARVAAFTSWYQPVPGDSNGDWFRAAYTLGQLKANQTVNGTDVCHGTYNQCRNNMTIYAQYSIQKLDKQSWQSPFL